MSKVKSSVYVIENLPTMINNTIRKKLYSVFRTYVRSVVKNYVTLIFIINVDFYHVKTIISYMKTFFDRNRDPRFGPENTPVILVK